MSIANYTELKEKVRLWAERSDLSDDLVEDFIYMAGADCSQQLRVPAMEYQTQLLSLNSRVTIPFDFVELRALTWEGDEPVVLEYLPWDQFVNVDKNGGLTTPKYFSRQGSTWYISGDPQDNSNILCHYYGFIPELGVSSQDNWLLAMSPMAYLYGSLKYCFEFLFDQERAAYWEAKLEKELDKLQAIAERAEHRGSTLIIHNEL